MGELTDGAKHVAKQTVAVPARQVVGFWRGLRMPFRGLRFVFLEHPSLVRFWAFPIFLTLVLLSLAFWAGLHWHDDLVDALWAPPEGEGFWISVLRALHWVLELIVLLLLWAGGLVAVVLLSNVLAAPFNDLLSEEVEHLVTGRKGPDFSLKVIARDAVRTIGLEILKLVIYAVVMVPLFVVAQFVPGVGQVVYSIFAFLFTALYFAIDYVDWPASRRNRSITYRFGMLTDHFTPMFGFGTGVWLFLFVPIVGLLFMPAAVAGGTLLFLELEDQRIARLRG